MKKNNDVSAEATSLRRRANAAFSNSEEYYKLLLDGILGIVYSFSNKRGGLYYSSYVNQLLGYSPEQLYSQPLLWHNSIHPDDIWQVDQTICEATTGKAFCIEYRIRDAQGNWHWFNDRSFSYQIDGGDVIIEGIAVDITERKQTEEALQENEQQHRKILQAAMDGFWLVDLQGHLLEVNETYCQMSGYSAPELLAMCISDFEANETTDATASHMRNVISKGEDRFETRHLRKDGTIYDVEISIQYQSIGGGMFVVFIHDITKRTLVEREKRQFYRDTIKSVTQGKLDLVSFEEAKEYLDPAGLIWNVESSADCATVRSKIKDFSILNRLLADCLGIFESAVGEAITNAIKHANGCQVYAGIGSESIWVAVSDSGQGISTMFLPTATLRRGFSSKISMGMGYTIMMDATDNIMLYTGENGTTVVLSINLKLSKPALSLDDFPDTWAEIGDV